MKKSNVQNAQRLVNKEKDIEHLQAVVSHGNEYIHAMISEESLSISKENMLDMLKKELLSTREQLKAMGVE